MNFKFIFFVALRYLKARKKSKKISASILLIICICFGVMALTVVIGIMNGFQLTFIEPILNLNSYHIQISGPPLDEPTIAAIRALPNVTACIPFCEFQGLVNGQNACIIRALPANINEVDNTFTSSFKTTDNTGFKTYELPNAAVLEPPGSIMLGNLLRMMINIEIGDSVSIITLEGNPVVTLQVSGIFKTGYDDIDSNWGLITLETAKLFNLKDTPLKIKYGIKLANHFNDQQAVRRLQKILGASYKVQSWRIFNSKFFGALLTEKIMMMVLLGLIFVIVAFGIFHSLRRTVYEKIEEIALFKALGTSSAYIKYIFIAEGFLIGIIGVLTGTIAGLLVGYNINEVFRITETVVNNFLFPLLAKLPMLHDMQFTPISIFSPDVYYIDQVPVRVMPGEAVLINIFAVACCVAAAYFASRKIADFKPASVLRYE